jgi:hypothetical protein
MNNGGRQGRGWSAVSALAAVLVGGAACDDEGDDTALGTVNYNYEDPFLYDYTYAGELAYSGFYWADDWAYGDFLFQVTGDGGTNGVPRWTPGNAIRALARGENVCPGQVTVTPKTATPSCTGGALAAVRNGVIIIFNGCQLQGGGRVDGTVDVQSIRSASQEICSPDTIITLGHTTTISNLTFTTSTGARLVVPNQVATGMVEFKYGQTPATVSINSSGQLQLFNLDGVLLSDHTHTGNRTFAFSVADKSYTVGGIINTQGQHGAGNASLSGAGITRTTSCCRPTAGTLTVVRDDGLFPGQHTWTFGPSCGAATFDGVEVTLPSCL